MTKKTQKIVHIASIVVAFVLAGAAEIGKMRNAAWAATVIGVLASFQGAVGKTPLEMLHAILKGFITAAPAKPPVEPPTESEKK